MGDFMAYTLDEYKKMSQNYLLASVVEIYLENSPIMNFMTFDSIPGGTIEFNRESVLPDTGFRAFNQPFTTSEGELEKVTESLVIAGGKITADRAMLKMWGRDRLLTDQYMQLKSLARLANFTFFKGDGTGNSFTGLQARATEIIAQGTAALSLSNLRKAIIRCKGSNKKVFLNEAMFLRISDAANSSSLGAQITESKDKFGEPAYYFAGVELVRAGETATGDEVLDFTEAGATTSIYVVSFDEDGMRGIENGGIENYEPVKESHANEYDIEWLMNYIIKNPKHVQRISEITDAPVVA